MMECRKSSGDLQSIFQEAKLIHGSMVELPVSPQKQQIKPHSDIRWTLSTLTMPFVCQINTAVFCVLSWALLKWTAKRGCAIKCKTDLTGVSCETVFEMAVSLSSDKIFGEDSPAGLWSFIWDRDKPDEVHQISTEISNEPKRWFCCKRIVAKISPDSWKLQTSRDVPEVREGGSGVWFTDSKSADLSTRVTNTSPQVVVVCSRIAVCAIPGLVIRRWYDFLYDHRRGGLFCGYLSRGNGKNTRRMNFEIF